MSGIRDYAKLAQSILQEVGGQPNIVDFSRCATRLRLILAQTPDNAKARVQSLPGVIAVVESAGQFQVVIGVHVAEVYSQMAALLGEGAKRGEEPRRRVLDTVIATMSAVFAPIVYILAAAGILQGILIVIQQFSAGFTLTGTYRVLNFMSWTPFAFLPVFIALTASRHFRCNTYIAVLCCCALINPEWTAMAGKIAAGEDGVYRVGVAAAVSGVGAGVGGAPGGKAIAGYRQRAVYPVDLLCDCGAADAAVDRPGQYLGRHRDRRRLQRVVQCFPGAGGRDYWRRVADHCDLRRALGHHAGSGRQL